MPFRSRPPARSSATSSPPDALFAGRYQLERELGRGGMGAVYEARDVGSDQIVALKLLTDLGERARELFQREFSTLAKLAHPRVICVYDYGVTRQGQPYYTMELLSGRDLVAAAPLDWLSVCAVMRDVCTSLALLHTQKLVHRDVNPLNVRLDEFGRAKLLDFGALAPFGVSNQLVGAPSCLAPESLRGEALDGRADLFALGVVAYWSLARRLPYAIERLEHAEDGWQTTPRSLSVLVPEVPQALDELVLSLLGRDPLSRPASAAEVIDRVSAIAAFSDEPLSSVAESHVTSATLVGRERALATVHELLSRTSAQRGAVVSIVGDRGSGKTRMLRELQVQAQLRGFVTVALSAPAHAGSEPLLRALIDALQRQAPQEVCAESGIFAQEPADASEHERTLRMQGRVARLLAEAAQARPLVLCVDDAHALSALGACVLPLLVHAALERALLLVVTRTPEQTTPAIEQLALLGGSLALSPLALDDVEKLVQETFGDVPHVTRLAHWLMLASRGNPSQLRAALLQLVHRHAVRYAGGAWLLPAELSERELPSDLDVLPESELAALSSEARALLGYLAAHRAPLSEVWLTELVDGAGEGLSQLQRARLVVRADAGFALAQPGVGTRLLGGLSEPQRKRLHARLAELMHARLPHQLAAIRKVRMAALSVPEILLGVAAGRHLLLGGDERGATTLLRNGSLEFTTRGEGLPQAVPLLVEAVELYQARGRRQHSYIAMMAVLALAGTYTDYRLAIRYSEQVLELAADLCGLRFAQRLVRYVGARAALYLGLLAGFSLFVLLPQRKATNTFRQLLLALMGLGAGALSICTLFQDPARAARAFPLLKPLGQFPRWHAVHRIHGFQLALLEHASGDYAEARERSAATLAYVRSPRARRALPESARLQLESGILVLMGPLDTFRSDAQVGETLRNIEMVHSFTSRPTHAACRVSYHANRGERESYLLWRERTDRLAAEEGATWRNDVQFLRMLWSTHTLCGDVLALKRGLEQLRELASQVPTVARLRDILHACYLCERGMPEEALARHEPLFQEALAQSGLRALQQLGVYARILRKSGRSADAVAVCERALPRVSEREATFTVMLFSLRVELPLALIALGEHARARLLLAALRDEQASHDNPMLHGLTHAACAELALAERNFAELDEQLAAMHRWVSNLQHPTLFAQYHRLAERTRVARGGGVSLRSPSADEDAEQAFHTEISRTSSG